MCHTACRLLHVTDNRHLTVAKPKGPKWVGGTQVEHTAAFEGDQVGSKVFVWLDLVGSGLA